MKTKRKFDIRLFSIILMFVLSVGFFFTANYCLYAATFSTDDLKSGGRLSGMGYRNPFGNEWSTDIGNGKGTNPWSRNEGSGGTQTTGKSYGLNTSAGYHIYDGGNISNWDIYSWRSTWYGACIHPYPATRLYSGVTFDDKTNDSVCSAGFYPGFQARCAWCGTSDLSSLHYSSTGTIKGIDYMNGGRFYFYGCPWCGHINTSIRENDSSTHRCKSSSPNRGYINYRYKTGDGSSYNGSSNNRAFLYNNDGNKYNGQAITITKTILGYGEFPEPDDYVVKGINTNSSGTGTWLTPGKNATDYFNNNVKSTDNWSTTVYYIYDPALHINYNLNGGSFGASHPTKVSIYNTITVSNPTRTGFKFMGWDITGMDNITHKFDGVNATGTTATRITATSFSNLRNSIGTVTFTAIWMDDSAPNIAITYKNVTSGTPYTPGTWTPESVLVTATSTDLGTGTREVTMVGVTPVPNVPNLKNTVTATTDPVSVSHTYTDTNKYTGTVTATDKAGTGGSNYIANPRGDLTATTTYGEVMIDKTPPEVSVSYIPADTSKDYNQNVTIVASAIDRHSGVRDTEAYRFVIENINSQAVTNVYAWQTSNQFVVPVNCSGHVEVRDNVGNIGTCPFSVQNIDKAAGTIGISTSYGKNVPSFAYKDADDWTLTPSSGTNSWSANTHTISVPGNQFQLGSYASQYTSVPSSYIQSSSIQVGTGNRWYQNVSFNFNAEDYAVTKPSVKKSGINKLEYKSTSNDGTLIDSGSTTSKTYNVGNVKEGYQTVNLSATDNVGIKWGQNLNVKVDNTKPQVTGNIVIPTLVNYKTSYIQNNSAAINAQMATTFNFDVTDYMTGATGSQLTNTSGISSVTLAIIDYDDPTVYKTYSLTETVLARASNPDSGKVHCTYTRAINTYTEFPDTVRYVWKLYVVDNAGNFTVLRCSDNFVPNVQIVADIYSVEGQPYNVFVDNTTNTENTAYFRTGDIGFVEITVIGKHDGVQFDFKDIGQETVNEIMTGNMLKKYNLGVLGNDEYTRVVSKTAGTSYTGNITKYVYTMPYDNIDFESNGTGIRIPVLLDVDDYIRCFADFYTTDSGSRVAKCDEDYYIFDNANTTLHWRTTYEHGDDN